MTNRVVLYCVFALSGAAGLIYELIWSRYLGLFVGHAAYAQILVLALFLGGMSVGALLVGRHTTRLAEPLIWYAAAELAVGIIGFFFHEIFRGVTDFSYTTLFPMLPAGSTVTIVKWLLAALLILPQSILLGMTFPLMSAGVMRRAHGQPGRILAMLYFTNSAGAAAGVLIAGFYFLKLAGLPGTLLIAALINVVVAAIAYLIGRSAPGVEAETALTAHDDVVRAQPVPAGMSLRRLLLLVSFGTAVASFIYEIAWIRMLSLVLGSATHSFELMLSAFILGLSLGALWVHSRADRFAQPLRALGITQIVMGALALATLPMYAASFEWTATLLATLQRSAEGYTAFNLARYLIALVIMLPATFCAGITLPLITRILITSGEGEKSIGYVYGVNTFGSIIGATAAGLILLPLLGLKLLLASGAIIDIALGTLLFARRRTDEQAMPRRAFAATTAAVAFIMLMLLLVPLDRGVMTIGVYRHGLLPPSGDTRRQILYYRDGRTATVASVLTLPDSTVTISTNGKPDGSLTARWLRPAPADAQTRSIISGDAATQLLAPLYGLAHMPAARQVAVIGFGTGMSSHFLLGMPSVELVETIEIEPAMIEGARTFYPANARTYDDARSRLVIDDAKSHFSVANRRYDLVFSEPSNPWVSGVASLFTDEFYQQVTRYLTDDGVLAQWLHLYEINDALLLSVLSALHRNFSQYEIFLTNQVDIVIVASNRSGPLSSDWRLFVQPEPGSDLATRALPVAAENMAAARVSGRAALAPLLDRWTSTNSDFYPMLDLGTERTRYMQTAATGFHSLATERYDFLAAAHAQRRGFGTVVRAPFRVPRMRSLALGAWLRSAESRAQPMVLPPGDPDGREAALARRNIWQLTAAQPPASWPLWLADAMAVEHDIHAGTAGVIDQNFYQELFERADRLAAPPPVIAAITFMRGLGSWNFPEAVAASQLLMAEALAGRNWIPLELLHDGAAWANLLTGDVTAAQHVHQTLGPRLARPATDLRMQLLEAYMLAAQSN